MKTYSFEENISLLLKIGIVFLWLIGLGVFSNLDELRWLFIDASAYNRTTGTILSSRIEPGGLRAGWQFRIAYEYKVGNEEFISTRVHFGYKGLKDPSYAESYTSKYPVGKQIVVFYDEDDPGISVLEPEIKWKELLEFYLIMSLVPLTVFSLSGYLYFRSHRKNDPRKGSQLGAGL